MKIGSCFIAVILLITSTNVLAQEEIPQAVNIESQNNSEGGLSQENTPGTQNQPANNIPTPVPVELTPTSNTADTSNHLEYGRHETSEVEGFWRPITLSDVLMIVTTIVIAVFTGLLWNSTHKLWQTSTSQVHAMNRANTNSRESLYAARETIEITKDTAQRQLRAYVLIDKIERGQFAVGQPLKATLVVKNYGQTPAYETINLYTTVIRPFPKNEGFSNPEAGEHIRKNFARSILGPGGEVRLQTQTRGPVTQQEYDGVQAGTMAVYFHGKINYRDIFNTARWTTFLFMIGGDRGMPSEPSAWVYHEGNEAN